MEKKRNDNEEMEIDLLELLMVMKKHLAAILLAGDAGIDPAGSGGRYCQSFEVGGCTD